MLTIAQAIAVNALLALGHQHRGARSASRLRTAGADARDAAAVLASFAYATLQSGITPQIVRANWPLWPGQGMTPDVPQPGAQEPP